MKIPRWLAWLRPRPPLVRLFTPRAQQALALARRVACEHDRAGSVDTEHLLAGILRLNQESIVQTLRSAGVDPEELKADLERPSATPAAPEEAMRMPFLASIKISLAVARQEARRLGDAHIGLEHLLLGMLVSGRGRAASILISRGLTIAHARTSIQTMRTVRAGQPSARLLIMFDVDGTLTESFDLDSVTYLDALRETLGFRDVSDDWAMYRHVTDTGILAELSEARLGRPPTAEETSAVQNRFEELLTARIAAAGGIRPVPGAAQLLSRLAGMPDQYAVAYASGGWKATARLKLRSAGLPVDEVPAAFADDGVSREEICRAARRRAEERHERKFSAVVYVGDGVWDVRTSRQLGYGFIGIGQGAGAAKLRAENAACVMDDFQDVEAFLAAVSQAAATAPASSRSGETTGSAH